MSHIADSILSLIDEGDSFGGMYDVKIAVPRALSQHQSLKGNASRFLNQVSFRATNIRPPTINYSVTSLKFMTWAIPFVESSFDVDKNSFSITFRVDRQWQVYDFFLAWKGLVGRPERDQPSTLPLTAEELDPPLVTPGVISPEVRLITLTGDLFSYPDGIDLVSANRNTVPSLEWVFEKVYPLKVEVNNDFNRSARQPMEMNVEFSYLFYSIKRNKPQEASA